MNKILKAGAISGGGIALFSIAFVMFAALSGVPLHQVAVLNKFVSPPQEEKAPLLPADPDREQIASTEEVLDQNARVTDAFVLDSPFSTEELTVLQQELKGRLAEIEQMRIAQLERERLFTERESNIDSRYKELMRLRTMLEEYESELRARGQEIERDEEAQKKRENLGWARLAKTFEEGEIEELVERLTSYEPEDAARILHALDAERAGELIRLLSPEDYRKYADAYRKVAD